jgi:hypothetical protein
MASKAGGILHHPFVCCRSGSRRGDTELVVAQWRCLVAYIKALDLLHKAMLVVLHHRTAMAIEMASDGGTFFAVAASFV